MALLDSGTAPECTLARCNQAGGNSSSVLVGVGIMRRAQLGVLLVVAGMAARGYAADGSSLKPPPGASVALVVFEDLQCPSCAQAAPLLEKAAEVYKVPLVIHDVPVHPWAFDAAMIARCIEQNYGRAMSDRFRDYVFQYQPQITKGTLRAYADKFCQDHRIALPMMLDPQGKIAAGIRADQELGKQVKVAVTPTIFVVTANNWAEVQDRSQLYTTIERMQREAPAPAPAKPKRKTQ